MYSRILVPVDLQHLRTLEKALATAADLARHYETSVVYIGVTASSPSSAAHDPDEYRERLDRLAQEQRQAHGRPVETRVAISSDPRLELDGILEKAVEEMGADLVVMGTHVPHFAEALFSSNTAHMVSHTRVSVFVVR